MGSPQQRRRRRHEPGVVAFLSFLWPGLGHAALGRSRSAAIYALPVAAIALGVGWELATDGIERFAINLLAPSVAFTAAILIVLLALWRIAAIADSVLVAAGRQAFRRPPIAAATGVLALAVVATHGLAGWYAWSFYQAGREIFVAAPDVEASPDPGGSVAGETDSPSNDWRPTPAATPSDDTARINVLLTGIDSSAQRTHALTDTLIVASIDPDSGSVVMVSFPRDITDFELPDGRTFTGKVNSLMAYADTHEAEFPDGGLPTLRGALGHLLGIPIHYYAAINLDGFERMIDVVGGVTVDNPRRIADPTYGGWTDGRRPGFFLSAGRHTLDGAEALAYVRSRRGVGDTDFTRAERQQQLLVALSRKLSSPDMLPRIPEILEAASRTVVTDFPPDRVGEMLELAREVDDTAVERVVLGRGYAVRGRSDDGVYRLRLRMDRVKELSVRLFGEDSAYAGQTSTTN